jgi:hypothetical protein
MEFVPHGDEGQETGPASGERFAGLIEANAEMLALADSTDMGKPVSDARTRDIPRTAANYRVAPVRPGQNVPCSSRNGPVNHESGLIVPSARPRRHHQPTCPLRTISIQWLWRPNG